VLKNKKILLGISGGIAAIKIPLLVRELKRQGCEVKVVMTKAAKEFVTPLSLSILSKNKVLIETFPNQNETSVDFSTWHINLASWADIMLVAPATANTLAKIAHGIADDALTTTILALRSPLAICPTMDGEMWYNANTKKNISLLKEQGCFILPPEEGELASGLIGVGRLPENSTIISFLQKILSYAYKDFSKKKILITAGPTYEPIDPVRYIGNRSSGKMGFALANAVSLRGGEVTLITGPTYLQTPRNVERKNIETTDQMFNEVKKHSKNKDAIIMCAAVSDFTPKVKLNQKIKKEKFASSSFTLELKKTEDILKYVGINKSKKTILVGFALETENEIGNAKKKLKEKRLDFIVSNKPSAFGTDTNQVSIISKTGEKESLPLLEKFDVANEVLNRVIQAIRKQ